MKRASFSRGRDNCFICFGLLLTLIVVHKVDAFPIITTQPESQCVGTNTTVTFTVSAYQSGSQSMMCAQWRRNGANLCGQFTNDSSGYLTSTLTISNAMPCDAGIYCAMICDADDAVNSTGASLTFSNLQAAPASDVYTNRCPLNSSNFNACADSAMFNNFNATNVIFQPYPGGIPGGAAVWLKWIAPTSGVVRLDTRGSDFDTTLGVYLPGTGGGLGDLIPVVSDDDAGGGFNSAVSFYATNGVEYEIEVDGFYGGHGNIVLNWSLEETCEQVPEIIQQPKDITVISNGTAELSVQVKNGSNAPFPNYQWYFNGAPVSQQATQSSYVISPVTRTNVGEYRVKVWYTGQSSNYATMSWPAQVQVNYEGHAYSQAQAKFRAATDPTSGPRPNAEPVSGYTGTHLYNTYGAEAEPGEPIHCDKACCTPFWFSYDSPDNGTLTVDANTPAFTNVLAIYTGPGDSFSNLVSVACASTNTGVGHEVAVFTVTKTNYWFVVDGLDEETGDVTLSYTLASLPTISAQPQSQNVSLGSNITLNVTASGTPSLSYRWRTNAVNYLTRTNGSLTVTNFQACKAGNYDVIITNTYGTVTSTVAILSLVSNAPSITTQPQSQSVPQGSNVTLNVTASGSIPLSYKWRTNAVLYLVRTTNSLTDNLTVSNFQSANAGDYDVIVTNTYGAITSLVATLSLASPPNVTTQPQSQNVSQGSNVTLSVTVSGAMPLSYRWRTNAVLYLVRTTNSLTDNLTVSNFQSANAGNYDVIVTNIYGAVTSSVAILSQASLPPSITTQPQSQTVPQGSNVTLSVSASGSIPLSYKWRTNTVLYLVRTTNSLTDNFTVTNFQAANEGNYDVIVTNTFGKTTSSVAMLYLNSPLRFGNCVHTNTNSFTFLLLGKWNTNYIIQTKTNLLATNWVSILTNSSTNGIISFVDTNVSYYSNRFFRTLVKTN